MSFVYDSFDCEAPDWVLGGGAQFPLVGVALLEVGQQQVVTAAAIQLQKAVRHLRKRLLNKNREPQKVFRRAFKTEVTFGDPKVQRTTSQP